MQAAVHIPEPAERPQSNYGCAMQLLERGRTVVAAARDAAKAKEVFSELGLSEGVSEGSGMVSAHLLHLIPCSRAACGIRNAVTLREDCLTQIELFWPLATNSIKLCLCRAFWPLRAALTSLILPP